MPKTTSVTRRIETAVASAVLVLAVVGLTLLPLTTPTYVRTLVSIVDSDELTGLGPDATLEAAETVRRFVLDPDAPALPEQIAGRPAFDEAAESHLIDVRDVLVPSRWVALAAAAIAAVWFAVRRRQRPLVAAAVRGSAWALLALMASAAVVGLTDFDSFFAWFHSIFFAEGTWTFPADALLIRVFPLPFWMSAAATWAVLMIMSSALLFTFAHELRVTHERTVYSHGGRERPA